MAQERKVVSDSAEANHLRRIANALEALVKRVCKRCNGSGKGRMEAPMSRSGPVVGPWEWCPACNGKGY